MAIYGKTGQGHYTYQWDIEPHWNGAPLSYSNYLYLEPYYTDGTTGNTFQFATSADYAPGTSGQGGNYADLTLAHTGNAIWYSSLHGRGGGTGGGLEANNVLNHPGALASPFQMHNRRYATTVLMDLGLGNAPHPGLGYAITNFSMLVNGSGEHQGGSYNYGTTNSGGVGNDYPGAGPNPAYNWPRLLIPGSDRITVSGDSYGIPRSYRDWTVIAQFQNAAFKNNCTVCRIINLGLHTSARSRLTIYGFKIIFTAMPNENTSYFGSYSV